MSGPMRGKGWRARPLSDYVLRELNPLVVKQGFGEASLLMQWREIVGARIANLCQPARLQWPPRPRGKAAEQREKTQEPATLVLRVEPGFSLEIQHMAPAIIDRINTHLGWRCVSRVTLKQEALQDLRPASPPRPALPCDPVARARAAAAAEGLKHDLLRDALIRLGESALATNRTGAK